MNGIGPRFRRLAALFAVLAAFAAILPCAARAADADSIRRSIKEQQEQAAKRKSSLARLSAAERSLFGDLAKLETRIDKLESELSRQEQRLWEIESEQADLAAKQDTLAGERDQALRSVLQLLRALWPLHRENVTNRLRGLSSWAETDRRFTWLTAVYARVGSELARLREKSDELTASMAARERLRQTAGEQLDAVNEAKRALLGDKLALAGRIREVRTRIAGEEEALNDTMSAIASLDMKLKTLSPKALKDMQGAMPWPVAGGDVVARFNPGANPPVRGLGLKLPEGTQVKAVAPGQVVHDDVLRGFGRVVIVSHGQSYYTLYAFLHDSSVAAGGDVQAGEVIGTSGYYPAAKGSGLYFELRFGQKAINPLDWLSARR